MPFFGLETSFLMNKAGKTFGLVAERQVAFLGNDLAQIEVKNGRKQPSKILAFTTVGPV